MIVTGQLHHLEAQFQLEIAIFAIQLLAAR